MAGQPRWIRGLAFGLMTIGAKRLGCEPADFAGPKFSSEALAARDTITLGEPVRLTAVSEALAAGQTVEAEGKGRVRGQSPQSIRATKMEFERIDNS